MPSRLAILLLSGLLVACSADPEPAASGDRPAAAAIAVAAVEVAARDLYRSLAVTGTIQPRHRVRIASRIAGLVDEVHVKEGQHVSASQVLAELNKQELAAELARARADEAAARLSFERAAELHARGVQSVAQLDAARVALEVAESEHALRRTRLGFVSVVSPLDAVVSARMVEPGETVQAHTTLFELISQQDLVIRVGVSELDVVHLRTGAKVTVVVDALPSERIEAIVSRVYPAADAFSRLTTVEIALPAESASLGLRPGFMARVTARIDLRTGVLAAPVGAVGKNMDGHYVYVIEGDALKRRAIGLGAAYADWVEVVNGLQAGELILESNPIGMRNGQSVRVVAKRSAVDDN